MSRFVFVIFLSFQFLASSSLVAQEPYIQKYSFYKGVSFRSVYSLVEDKNGFIWFTSDDGLFRYDGTQFINYKHPEQTSFSGTYIKEDRLGRIWYQTFDGDFYYCQNNELKKFSTISNSLFFTFQISDKYIYSVEENQIVIYDLQTLKPIKKIKKETLFMVSGTLFRGDYYYVLENNLWKIDKNFKETKVCTLPNREHAPHLLCTSKDAIYITFKASSHNSIMEYKNQKVRKVSSVENSIYVNNIQFLNSKLYLTTTEGLKIYDPKTGINENNYFKTKSFSAAIYDRKQNLWLSSPNEGLYLVSSENLVKVNSFDIQPVRLALVNNELLFTTKNSEINRMDKKAFLAKNLRKIEINSEGFYLEYFKKNNLLVSGFSNGYTYFDDLALNQSYELKYSLKKIVQLDHKYYAVIGTGYAGFFHLPNTKLTSSKFDKYIKKLPEVINDQLSFYRLKGSISEVRGKSLVYDSINQTVYFVNVDGLFTWKNGVVNEIRANNKPIVLKSIFSFNGKIIGIKGTKSLMAISSFSTEDSRNFKPIFKHKDLTSVRVYDENLVVKTNRYLYIYKCNKSQQISEFNRLDISNFEVFDFALDGKNVWISTNEGLMIWDCQKDNSKGTLGNFIINNFLVNEIPQKTRGKTFDYNQNNVSIHFSMLDFGIKTVDKVYYKLNDNNWQELDLNAQSLNLSSLAPNSYTIRFKGFSQGKELDFESITFRIQPPFWSSWWFRILLFALAGILLFGFYRYQMNRLIKKNRLINDKVVLENKLNKSMITSLKAQMNPHFFYNALNSIQGLVLTGEREKASASIGLFSDLSRSVLESSRKNEISLYEEIELLSSYLKLEQMRMPKINYSIQYAEKLPLHDLYIPPMILQPIVENSVKHGLANKENGGMILLNFKLIDDILIIEIRDDGIGREAAEKINKFGERKGSSFSAEANLNRIDLLNESFNLQMKQEIIDLMDENNNPSGTLVRITIPQQEN